MTDLDNQNWIKKCEDLKLEPYVDTTGHLTIGWGHNLANGITTEMAEFIFQCDYKQAVNELQQCAWYVIQPINVKYALINMNFNLGIEKLSQFKKMIAALYNKDYTTAASEALNSLWAQQVGDRAKDIAVMIREAQ